MTTSTELSNLVGALTHTVAGARMNHRDGYEETARHYVQDSVAILDSIIELLPREGVRGMTVLGTPLLDARSHRLAKRLINHYGGERAAEEWLGAPNAFLHGETPARHFRLRGEGWFLDATCEWPLEDFRRSQVANI